MSRAQRSPLAPTLRVYMLGSFRIERENETVVLPRRKLEPLLAYLLLYPEPHTREKLAALLWGDYTDEQARASLRTHLAALRKLLGEELLLAERETVQLDPDSPLWVDARAFAPESQSAVPTPDNTASPSEIENRKSKIRLYRGPLLADHYDDWILPLREHYHQTFLNTQLGLIELERSASAYADAIESAQRLLTIDPANERAHQHLMFLYVVTGNRPAALAQYDKCVDALEAELSALPAPETVALAKWLKQSPATTPSLIARLTNLPIPLTSFIGRTEAIRVVKTLLTPGPTTATRPSLVTLTGAGGSGKTRMAIQLGTELIESFPDGVWWVELAPLTDAAQVPSAIARALGVTEAPPNPLVDTIAEHLQNKRALLILDNCEHLIATCAELIGNLLPVTPSLTVLATSREPLGIAGEQVWRVPSLTVPSLASFSVASYALEYEAVRLFVERARSVRADFTLTNDNALAVAQICARLDGIPLALELAAARVAVLTPAQIAARLDDRFALLTQGSRTALPRQQTLRALIDWSYDLLPRREQILFQRLAVFEGGAALEAVEQICSDAELAPRTVLDSLSALVNKSLVLVQESGSASRYAMLESLHEYAREKLDASGQADLFFAQHLAYWHSTAQEGMVLDEFTSAGADKLKHEEENLSSALRYALDTSPTAETRTRAHLGVRLVSLLAALWQKSNQVQEPYHWLQRARAVADRLGDVESETRASLTFHAGAYARFNDDLNAATEYLTECIALEVFPQNAIAHLTLSRVYSEQVNLDAAIAEALTALELYIAHDDALGQARARAQLGSVAIDNGDWSAAQTHLRDAVQLSRTLNQPRLLLISLREQSNLAYFQGDLDSAERYANESLVVNSSLNADWFQAAALQRLGMISARRGHWERARSYMLQSLALWDRSGKRSFVATRLMTLANIEVGAGNFERAATLWGAADALLQATGIEVIAAEKREFEDSVAVLRVQLDESTRLRAYALGNTMAYPQMMAYVLNPA